ncbi:MAG TPA: gluconate:H+ symporter [Candidatus Sulfopaludibacter sp.]|jgi:gluconate transporter|nr:gluconate:H+ symporter [Candidatus Sulfopaludibacter sp.]
MAANGNYLILITVASIALLLVLILAVKLHAFLAMMLTSMALGLAAGMAPEKVLKSIQSGFGDALGFIAVVVGLGAMIGRFLEQSGGGRALADWLLEKFGKDRAAWALLVAGFLVGLPLFFEVGVVIMAPLIWSVTRETKRSLLYYALPTLSALTIVHSLVPPHPAPAAASQLFGADLGHTILYGIAVSIPAGIVGGMVYGLWIAKRIHIEPPDFAVAAMEKPSDGRTPPSIPMVILLLLLPVLLIFGATLANMWKVPFRSAAVFVGHPFTALAITTLVSIYFFGLRRGVSRAQAAKMAAESLAPMGALLCIMGAGGAFKQIIVDSGVGTYAGKLLLTSSISPLLVAFVIAMAMRLAQGSATVAIITAAGIVAPIVKGIPGYSPDILVLALCCGGSGFSHVSDSGFWLVNQYFNMSVSQTLKTWTAMKVVSMFVGLALVLLLQALLR